MIMISCRKDFSNSRAFADRNLIRNIPNLKRLDQFDDLDEFNLREQTRGKHVLILVHGFRNPLQNVADSYARLLKGLTDSGLMFDSGYGLVLGFTWPGFETPLGFFPAIPFANRSAGFFRKLLEALSESALTLDIQTHSLGARVSLQALAGGGSLFVDNLMLTAPAVDDEVLEPKREFNGGMLRCRRCLVYHSDKDSVLKFAYPIGEFDRALGLKGPEHPDAIKKDVPEVFVVDCKNSVKSHGGYRSSGAYYAHWGRVLADEVLPRFETLKA